ncbi:ADP-ribosylation family protein [Yinghuangia sp. YIM S09857]|uniref:ADP-ribosylation family protein n=1 Tax=Yinghuangia sp. YIM S09857 TaxID=3436929 RepID=UPI003F531DF1
MPEERARTQELHAAVAERVRRDWGLELPESLFRYDTFLGSLDQDQARLLRDMELRPFGISDLFADPDAQPKEEGVDVRAHGRFYRDPPEFLTFMHGGSDGLHYGLWFEDGETCARVASYYNNDAGELDITASTPLEAIRARLELFVRDAHDYHEGEELAERLDELSGLRDAVTAFETGDREQVGDKYSRKYTFAWPPILHDCATTLDGGGALADGETVLSRQPQNRTDLGRFAGPVHAILNDADALAAAVQEARRRCEDGDPAEALALGRDLHWTSGFQEEREAYAHDLLTAAYEALDRPALAGVAEAHYRHRQIKSVQVI